MRLAAALAASVALVTLAAPAAAQPGAKKPPAEKAPDSKLAEAKKLFEEGTAAYALGNYEQAIGAWEKSYELSKKPLIFESIGNAYERMGNARKAYEYLTKWRDAAPPEEKTVLLEARIRNLEARAKREEEQEAASKASAEKAKTLQAQRDQDDEAARRSKAGLSIAGIALAAGGGAAIVAGVVVAAVGAGKRPDDAACKTSGGKTFCLDSARSGIQSSNTLAIAGDVTWIVGAAAAAAGVTLIVLRKVSASKEAAAPPPAAYLVPTGTGLAIRGSF
jgi:tetratricopeptide (TPR) repeat protein